MESDIRASITGNAKFGVQAENSVLPNAAAEATSPDRILQVALTAWRQGNFVEVVDQFNDQFTFTDYALELEFKDKRRLSEFFAKIRDRFPGSERKDNIIFSGGDHIIGRMDVYGY